MKNPIKTWQGLPDSVKSSTVFFMATMLIKGIVFLTTPVFTRIMSESDMGIVGTYASWKGIYEAFAILSLTSAGVFNVGMSQYRDSRSRYMSCLVGFELTLAAVCGVILFFSYDYIADILNIPKSLVLLMIITTAIMPAETFWVARQRYEYKYKAAFCLIVISTIVGQAVAITSVFFADGNFAVVRMWSSACISIPLGLFFVVLLFYRGKKFFNKEIWVGTFTFAVPLIPHYLSSTVLVASDRIMISALDSLYSAGIYTVVYGIGAIGSIVWGAIQGSLTPYIYDKMDEGNCDGVHTTSRKLVLFFGLVCVFIALIAPEVVRIMGPESYFIGVYAIPPIVGAILISCLYNLFSTVEFYYKKAGFITAASIVTAAVNIGLNFIFIPIFGFIAAGYTTLAAYILLSVMHYVNMKKIQKYEIFKGKELFLICFGFIAVCIAVSVFYKLFIVRYALCLILIAAGIWKRKMLIKMVRKK